MLTHLLWLPTIPHSRRVYSKLKYESGVHRVQRVPATETSGRVHTSTATVAIMPEVDDVDVKIDPKVRLLCFRALMRWDGNPRKPAAWTVG